MALSGFYLGVKFVDYFFFDETKYQILREKIEDEYWAKNGIFFIKGNLLK